MCLRVWHTHALKQDCGRPRHIPVGMDMRPNICKCQCYVTAVLFYFNDGVFQ